MGRQHMMLTIQRPKMQMVDFAHIFDGVQFPVVLFPNVVIGNSLEK